MNIYLYISRDNYFHSSPRKTRHSHIRKALIIRITFDADFFIEKKKKSRSTIIMLQSELILYFLFFFFFNGVLFYSIARMRIKPKAYYDLLKYFKLSLFLALSLSR